MHTGIKAVDLFAPLPRGGIVRIPFAAGVGMVVLLGELCRHYVDAGGDAIWTGFAQKPFDVADWDAEMAEFGLADQIHSALASFKAPADLRRAALPALRHRLVLTYEAAARRLDADDLIDRILAVVPVS